MIKGGAAAGQCSPGWLADPGSLAMFAPELINEESQETCGEHVEPVCPSVRYAGVGVLDRRASLPHCHCARTCTARVPG